MWDDHRTVSSFNSDDILVSRPLPSVCAGQVAAQCLCWSSRCPVSVLVKPLPSVVLVKSLPSVCAGQAAAQCPCWSSRCPVSVLVKPLPSVCAGQAAAQCPCWSSECQGFDGGCGIRFGTATPRHLSSRMASLGVANSGIRRKR